MPRPKEYSTKIDRRTRTQFVVACEGQRSEELYLRFMTDGLRRVEVIPLPTGEDGHSSPHHLLERLRDYKERNRVKPEDNVQLWMVLDVDHHFKGNNVSRTHAVISEAERCGIHVAISNPRFELWLLLHFEDVTDCAGDFCEQRLRHHLGGYSHSRYNPNKFKEHLGDAIKRAQALDTTPDERLPSAPGTRLHHLMRAILEA